jgi:hypothetical protein
VRIALRAAVARLGTLDPTGWSRGALRRGWRLLPSPASPRGRLIQEATARAGLGGRPSGTSERGPPKTLRGRHYENAREPDMSPDHPVVPRRLAVSARERRPWASASDGRLHGLTSPAV